MGKNVIPIVAARAQNMKILIFVIVKQQNIHIQILKFIIAKHAISIKLEIHNINIQKN